MNWFMRLSKWEWTPIILGVIACFLGIVVNQADAVEAAPSGIGIICFAWLAMVKGFVK